LSSPGIIKHANYSAPDRERNIVMSVSVFLCVCVFVRDHIFETTCIRPIFTNFFVHVAYGRGSVLLCTSGFMDDVMFDRKPWLLDVAPS